MFITRNGHGTRSELEILPECVGCAAPVRGFDPLLRAGMRFQRKEL
jgi:hypothetical protein